MPVESASDFYYVNFTRRLYHTIRNTDVGRQSTEDWVAETAMTLAYYLEDVVSGLGFWRTFVTKHKALYGKYLPFFEVDEKEYYLDEINLPDVCFLLWMSVQDNKREALVNPENPYLTELSEMLYRQLDKEFERAPINDDLLAQLKNPDTYSDFSRLSLVGMKMLGGTYLFRPFVKMTEGVVVREVNSLLTPGTQLSLREYTVRFMQVFGKNTGILALRGAEWMSAWLELWGLPDESRRVAEMEVVPLAYYRLQTYDAENLTLEGFDGTTYTLPRDAFQPLVEQLMNINKVCLTTLVHYVMKRTAYPDAPKTVVLTFSNKAARDVREKIDEIAPEMFDRLYVGTIHSFCLDMFRRYGHLIGMNPDAKHWSAWNAALKYSVYETSRKMWLPTG